MTTISFVFKKIHSSNLLLSHLHYKFWKKKWDIIEGDSGINKGVYTKKIGFKVLCDNIEVFH